MAWGGGAGLNYGQENYFSGSQHGQSLTEAQKLDAYRRLMGRDLNLFDDASYRQTGGGFNGAGSTSLEQYRNLFEPVMARGGRFGTPTGEYQLRTAQGRPSWGNAANSNQARADALRAQLISQAYDDAIKRNLFSQTTASDEDYQKHLQEVGFEGRPGVDKWIQRRNNLTGETDWVLERDTHRESNFYRRNKDAIITGGAGVLGFALGGPAGAMAAASLANTTRDIYKARDEHRRVRMANEDFNNDLRRQQQQDQPEGGNLFRSAGEGVVEYATKDVANRRKGTYVKGKGGAGKSDSLWESEPVEVKGAR